MAKTEATRCNLTALRKATRRVSQLYDQALATSGLRGTQRAILVHVRRTGAPTMGELAAALVLDRTALNHNLKPLARDGLLTITVDKNDRRSRLVRLTKRGEARLADSQAAWLEAQDRFETAFGARQAADLRQTLELVAALEFGEPAADVPAS
ncbi:MarR family winged helix-turn-helix transcriptional regulator [Bradyrhizobium uaiense]|uniref:Winged helix-turn-helix transcriptional regulator n=1 Tax=Bradyrhizobium uaiense TaxID=2594946 RepID=A0A6P1BMY1_9BRAD|nr:MarR family winged helix-turn-helix transcriptional regulator [Bradyrhizobium uaiense]NEU99564.1 winged helix-turn-helix transcriptional regulator [Bradyrhizobium uaiense]